MKVVEQVSDIAQLPEHRGAVFTMGALHAGHAALMRKTRELIGPNATLIVSIFVNPRQFNDPSDLAHYPRTLEHDLRICEEAGADVVFTPSVEEMFPPDLPQFSAGNLGTILEGAFREGHFDAVATVVHRLLDITKPQVTCFGEKDYQQLAVVRAMVAESGIQCDVVGLPTVRDTDGLALSSRNQRLSPEQRREAVVVPRALEAVANALAAHGDVEAAIAAGKKLIDAQPLAELDYLVVRSTALGEVPKSGEARALIAVRFGGIRLIDNCAVNIAGGAA